MIEEDSSPNFCLSLNGKKVKKKSQQLVSIIDNIHLRTLRNFAN